ncbi:hypothetical protein QQ045_023836 [Rhodiola kirilowii]
MAPTAAMLILSHHGHAPFHSNPRHPMPTNSTGLQMKLPASIKESVSVLNPLNKMKPYLNNFTKEDEKRFLETLELSSWC